MFIKAKNRDDFPLKEPVISKAVYAPYRVKSP